MTIASDEPALTTGITEQEDGDRVRRRYIIALA